MSALRVGVVVPYFENPVGLERLLTALEHQDLPADRFEVVVSDDGSAQAPALPATSFSCRVIRQENLGFRAAAARNAGAAQTAAPYLVFLDGDMMPEPAFLSTLLAGMERARDGHGVLAVGARRHVDLSACPPHLAVQWAVRGEAPGVCRLPDPTWLADGYARTRDLQAAGEEDFRLVISALMGMDRDLFERSKGFDKTLTAYGGEDWDLAYRCWQLGARFTHIPGAVAWHDGPDLGARPATRDVKDAETLALAARIPLPSTRGRGVVFTQPDVVVRVHGHADHGEAYLTAQHLLHHTDAGLWFVDRACVPEALTEDPRVRAGEPPRRFLDRCRFQVEVHAPLTLDTPLRTLCGGGEQRAEGLLTIRSTRRVHRGESDPSAVCRAARAAATDQRVEGRIGHGN